MYIYEQAMIPFVPSKGLIMQEQRPFFVSRVHDKFGRLLECPATDVLVVLVVGVGGVMLLLLFLCSYWVRARK